ncbi:MAG TPA: hypothetical protein DEQ05_04575, partial [Thermodesulfobacterium commune]|nr:hypothetical protein [Thermodesulfobacterium commune]
MEGLLKKFFQPSKKEMAAKAAFPKGPESGEETRLKSLGVKVFKGFRGKVKGRLGFPVYLSFFNIVGQGITGNFNQMGK